MTPRATATMSCDVKPAGLSTSRTPSGAGLSVGLRATLLDLSEERFDARRASDALVVTEQDLRRGAKAKGLAETRAQMAGEAAESLERGCPLGVRSEHADEDLRRAEITRDLDGRHRDESDDTRILRSVREKAGDFFANRF